MILAAVCIFVLAVALLLGAAAWWSHNHGERRLFLGTTIAAGCVLALGLGMVPLAAFATATGAEFGSSASTDKHDSSGSEATDSGSSSEDQSGANSDSSESDASPTPSPAVPSSPASPVQ